VQDKIVHTLHPEIQLLSILHGATSGVVTDTNGLVELEFSRTHTQTVIGEIV